MHFEITGDPYNLIGSQQCNLFARCNIFCSKLQLFPRKITIFQAFPFWYVKWTVNNSTKTVFNINRFFLCVSRVYSKKHVKKERARERAELAKAWNLLDPLGKGRFAPFSMLINK